MWSECDACTRRRNSDIRTCNGQRDKRRSVEAVAVGSNERDELAIDRRDNLSRRWEARRFSVQDFLALDGENSARWIRRDGLFCSSRNVRERAGVRDSICKWKDEHPWTMKRHGLVRREHIRCDMERRKADSPTYCWRFDEEWRSNAILWRKRPGTSQVKMRTSGEKGNFNQRGWWRWIIEKEQTGRRARE